MRTKTRILYSFGTVGDGHGAQVRARAGAARGGGVPASDRAGVWGGAPR